MDFLNKGMKAQFKLASNFNSRFVAIYGEDERLNNKINIKDQQSGTETTIDSSELYNHIIQELMKPTESCTDCKEESCDTCEDE